MEKDADTTNVHACQHSAQNSETDTHSFEHKVVGLRRNLTNRKRAYQSHIRKERFRTKFLSTFVVGLLLAGVVSYYYRADILPRDKSVPPAPAATPEPQTASVAPETVSEIAPQRLPNKPPTQIKTAQVQVFSAPAIPHAAPSPPEVPAAPPVPEPQARMTHEPTTPPAEAPQALRKEPEPPVVVAKQSQPAVPAPPLDHIRIARSRACASVQARQCRNAQENFSISGDAKPYVWMLVYSKSLPYVLKHVYYHEGRKYAQVLLNIKHERMRTWSTIRLKGQAHVGSWRVDIESADGTVLDQVAFEVSP